MLVYRKKGWFDWLPSWKPTSLEHLVQAETEVLESKSTIEYFILKDMIVFALFFSKLFK